MQCMSSGGVSGVENSVQNSALPNFRLTLVQLKLFKLGESDLTARHASHGEFGIFACSVATVEGGSEKWTVEERRDFLNWCVENKVLEAKEGRLVPCTPSMS